ncbi:U6 snRNA-associated Sm-like protein LSm6 [Taenia solium]|eukprot:TsM_001001500 transcript=TsM_001001500 gene=TsM_001001500
MRPVGKVPLKISRFMYLQHKLLIAKMSQKQTPRDFLKLIIGRPVVVKLNSGADYRGVLISLDGYMNVVLEQTEEYVEGQLKNRYGDAFIRGNNGTLQIIINDVGNPHKNGASGGLVRFVKMNVLEQNAFCLRDFEVL